LYTTICTVYVINKNKNRRKNYVKFQRQRRIILDLAITLDGYIEGKNGEVDWCIMDDDMRSN